MQSRDAAVVFFVVLIALLAMVSVAWRASRGGSMLEEWARANGFQLLSQEDCWFFKGPFFWTSSKGQKIYRVTVRDRGGRTRSGYVRCGGYFAGLLSDRVDVRWDE